MSILDLLRRKPDSEQQLTGRVVDLTNRRGGWGHHVSNIGDRYYSHMSPRLVDGDVVLMDMQSGKVGRMLVSNAEYPGDPVDMAFLDLTCVSYVE